jgi:hypothetical protein
MTEDNGRDLRMDYLCLVTPRKISRPFASLTFVSGSNPSETVKVTHQPKKIFINSSNHLLISRDNFFSDLLGLLGMILLSRSNSSIQPGRFM